MTHELYCSGLKFDALPEADRKLLSASEATSGHRRSVHTETLQELSLAGLRFALADLWDSATTDGYESGLDAAQSRY